MPIKTIKSKEGKEGYLEKFNILAQWIYISCWHKEDCENYSMWKIYGQISEAVAIETTMSKLELAYLKDFDDSLAYLDEVTYVQIENTDMINMPRNIRHIGNPPSQVKGGQSFPHLLFCFLKDKGYESEKEVRLVALDKAFTHNISNPKKGIYINFKGIDSFIQKIRLSPTAPRWFNDVVSDLIKKYGIDADIEHSRFFKQPPTFLPLS